MLAGHPTLSDVPGILGAGEGTCSTDCRVQLLRMQAQPYHLYIRATAGRRILRCSECHYYRRPATSYELLT